MTTSIYTDSETHDINPKQLVISIYDCIKCAAASGNSIRISIPEREVQILAQQIRNIDTLDIRWEETIIESPF